ncbi:MAG: ShlB/FhaC/HecB family hemolysin secretion/activation protein [Sphingosinicella sp.]|uniref:ShlB/FhaC/HecB family hemolysin secretion/activation protein n=1 Tax=Sphingosinicella sp. TaxID=1917971 RepID=UPI004037BBC0
MRGTTALVASPLLFIASAAFAQVPPQQPVAPTREEVERPLPERAEQPRARLAVEGEIERAPCALDRPEYASIRFTLSDVVFEDLRGLSADALRPAYAAMVGQEVPVASICEIRDRAAAILQEAGYVAAIEVPEQRIADGTVRLRVVMARLVALRVRGDAGRAEALIASYLERLTEQEVFNRYEAERYLLLAGDLPGYNVRLALRSAGQARGEVIGEVTVQRVPALVDFTVQNLGSRELGRWGGLLRAQFFGLTGLGDRTSIAAYSTADFDEQQSLQIAHDFRLGGEGLAIGGQLTFAWANPDLGLANAEIGSDTLFATIEASYPFVRRQDGWLRGTLGLDLVNQDIDFNGIPINRDRLRVLFARIAGEAIGRSADPRYAMAAPAWRLGASAELRQGLDILGATTPCGPALAACLAPGIEPPTRLEGDPTATVLRGALYGEARPTPALTFAAQVRGQYSGSPLLSFEEFSGGNYTIGRGYDPGTILGDRGIAVQAELRYGSVNPRSARSFAIEPFVFVDQAWSWNEERLFPIPRQELTSVGGGIRAGYGNAMRLELLVAFPLDRTFLQPDRDPRILLTITTRLWPWSF